MRVQQGTVGGLGETFSLGVMNVWTENGSLTAQVAVWDTASTRDDTLQLRENDEFAAGEHRYRVARIMPAGTDVRAWIEVEAVS
jgi:hypothetical protein